MTIKNKIPTLLDDLANQCKPRRLSNADTLLYDAFVWQEIVDYASKQCKASMAELTAEIGTDDSLRDLDVGEHSVQTGDKFCFIAKIGAPRECFDQDTFISAVARKFEIAASKLKAMAEVAKKPTKPSLSKRVVEL